MKKLSEVYKFVGLSRAMLQKYDKKGIVKHTGETEAGYWLYDDEAINKLLMIRIYHEAGYSMKETQEILSHGEERRYIAEKFLEAKNRLQEKRKRIDGYIQVLEAYSQVFSLPYASNFKYNEKNLSCFDAFKDKDIQGFKEFNEKQTQLWSNKSDEEIQLWTRLEDALLMIGAHKDHNIQDEEVQVGYLLLKSQLHEFLSLIIYSKEEVSNMTQNELIAKEYVFGKYLVNSPDIKEFLDAAYGVGTQDFVLKVIERYWKTKFIIKE